MKQIIVFLLILSLISFPVLSVSAAEVEADLEYIDSEKDVVFWIEWDVETPSVIFIAPDETEYDPSVARENTSTIMGENVMYYVVENAMAGQWRIRYDKGDNSVLDVSVHDYQNGLFIQSFAIGDVDGDYLDAEFFVASKEERTYNYKISAMIERTGAQKELKSGSGYTNESENVTLNLSSLTSYSAYVLQLYVWYSVDETDVSDFAFSTEFSYTNVGMDSVEYDYTLTIKPLDCLVDVTWDDVPWGADSVIVAIFEDDADEPTTFDEYGLNEYDSVQLSYDPDAKKIAIELTVSIEGTNTQPLRKSVTLSDFGLSLTEKDAINATEMPVSYTGFNGELVNVNVNGYASELVFTGEGSVSVKLGDGSNSVIVEYTDENGIVWKVEKSIFVDRIAPILNMSQSYDGTQSNIKKINISGTALDCEKVTVNGNNAALDDEGYFVYTVDLYEGNNVITVIASDALGNQSQYVAGITYFPDGKGEDTANTNGTDSIVGIGDKGNDTLVDKLTDDGSYWVFMISGVLGILIVVYAIIFWSKKDKGGDKDNKTEVEDEKL